MGPMTDRPTHEDPQDRPEAIEGTEMATPATDIDPELAEVLDAPVEDILRMGDMDELVGDAAQVLDALDAEEPSVDLAPSAEIADEVGEVSGSADVPAPDLAAWADPNFAVKGIDVSEHAHDSSATPAERVTLIVGPLLIVALLVAIAWILLG